MSYKLYNDLTDIPVELSGRVAVKLHMGEAGNPNHVSPRDVAVLVEKIKENGGEPFLVDTTTLYKKKRYTVKGYEQLAKKHGFGKFEVVIAADDEWKDVDGIKVARPIAEADSMLLLSHVTGHMATVLGAAMKNLSMGCVVKDGKRRIHAPMGPVYDETLCTQCWTCVGECPYGCLGKNNRVRLNLDDCPACGRCIRACTTGAMGMRSDGVTESYAEFVLAVRAVMSLFRKDEIFCINSLKKITRYCDCASPSPLICKDIGYITGNDPFRLDVRSARLIRSAGAKLNWGLWETFENIASSLLD